MSIKTKHFFIFLPLAAFLFLMNANNANAAVSLPWSTTYNCPDWTQGDIYFTGTNSAGQTWKASPLDCDGVVNNGAWLTSSGSKEQITSSANYPGGWRKGQSNGMEMG